MFAVTSQAPTAEVQMGRPCACGTIGQLRTIGIPALACRTGRHFFTFSQLETGVVDAGPEAERGGPSGAVLPRQEAERGQRVARPDSGGGGRRGAHGLTHAEQDAPEKGSFDSDSDGILVTRSLNYVQKEFQIGRVTAHGLIVSVSKSMGHAYWFPSISRH